MKTKMFLPLLLSCLAWSSSILAQDYAEPFRPQYHISPSYGFMGDPNGPLKYQGKYHLFWWGHLRSDDLVHWTQLTTNALQGTPGGFGNWSGSVVVDEKNTGGFNTAEDTAMIAVYTLHENATGIQRQAISISLNHVSFQYYTGNPVIDSNQPDFRDPQVFWHEPTARWVMVVAKPVLRAIEIYTSEDLKTWTYQSTFNTRGAKREVWEVPDLFQLPLNGDPSQKKWVMTCGMGPNKMQYWVGDFDGTTFTLDENDNLFTGKQVAGSLFEDFEGDYSGWTVEGSAFGNTPATGTLVNQQEVTGFTGHQLVNSYTSGDTSTGKLISMPFEIEKRFLNFQIGGGAGSGLALRVIVDGEIISSTTSSSNAERMQWRGVDLGDFLGKTAQIEIVDEAVGGWGHILVDHIVFSDVQYDTRIENANWMDWGYDFYAAKTFRNYDFDDERTIGLAWMGNWTYAQNVPTTPWKGCQSIPRAWSLIEDGNGYEMVQTPISELQMLRKEEFVQTGFPVEGTQPLEGFDPSWNVFELKLSIKITNKDQQFGINLAEGTNQKVVVRYNAGNSNLYIDRTYTPFDYSFKRIANAPVFLGQDSILDLHIFVDQSSVEVFANGYKTRLTCLAFTNKEAHGISLFSEGTAVEVLSLQAWKLSSIWGITANSKVVPELDPEFEVFPNPFHSTLSIKYTDQEQAAGIKACSVLDFQGNLVASGTFRDSIDLDLANLPAGLYLLVVRTENRIFQKKIMRH